MKDWTGETVGDFTVLGFNEELSDVKKYKYMFDIQCNKCGHIETRRSDCFTKDIKCRHCKDIKIGNKYGSLTVLEEADPYISPSGTLIKRYKCRCDCGNIVIRDRPYLLRSPKKTCGKCDYRKIGDKIGRVTMISDPYHKVINGKKVLMIQCECDCGTIFETRAKDFFNEKVKSCGCARNEVTIKRNIDGRIKNEYEIKDDYVIGYTTNGSRFLFDLEDYDVVSEYCWRANIEGYICTNRYHKEIKLHRLIMNPQPDMIVDHINHDVSDNRRSNLRVVDKYQSAWNTRPKNNLGNYKGVHFRKDMNKWAATITVRGEKHYLGQFDTEDDAITARKIAEDIYHQEYKYCPEMDARNLNSGQD